MNDGIWRKYEVMEGIIEMERDKDGGRKLRDIGVWRHEWRHKIKGVKINKRVKS